MESDILQELEVQALKGALTLEVLSKAMRNCDVSTEQLKHIFDTFAAPLLIKFWDSKWDADSVNIPQTQADHLHLTESVIHVFGAANVSKLLCKQMHRHMIMNVGIKREYKHWFYCWLRLLQPEEKERMVTQLYINLLEAVNRWGENRTSEETPIEDLLNPKSSTIPILNLVRAWAEFFKTPVQLKELSHLYSLVFYYEIHTQPTDI